MTMRRLSAALSVLCICAPAAWSASSKPAAATSGAADTSSSSGLPDCSKLQANQSCIAAVDPNMFVPSSPAFDLLGVSPASPSQPTTPSQLAGFLVNGLDKNGNFQSGLALDILPFMMASGDHITLDQYRKSPFLLQPLLRTQFSFGTAKGATDTDKTSKYALSLRSVLFDLGDAKADASEDGCFDKVANGADFPDDPSKIDDWVNKTKVGWQKCTHALAAKNWNRSALALGLGSLWTTDVPSTVAIGSKNTVAYYVSATYGFEGTEKKGFFYNHMQIGANYRHVNHEIDPDASVKGSFYAQNLDTYGGFVRVVGQKLSIAVGLSETDAHPIGRPQAHFLTATLTPNIRLGDKLWLELNVGGTTKQADGSSGKFIITSFKYNFDGLSDLL